MRANDRDTRAREYLKLLCNKIPRHLFAAWLPNFCGWTDWICERIHNRSSSYILYIWYTNWPPCSVLICVYVMLLLLFYLCFVCSCCVVCDSRTIVVVVKAPKHCPLVIRRCWQSNKSAAVPEPPEIGRVVCIRQHRQSSLEYFHLELLRRTLLCNADQ